MKSFVAKYEGCEHSVKVEPQETGKILFSSDQRQIIADVMRSGEMHYSVVCGDRTHDIRYYQKDEQWQCYFDGELVEFDFFDEASLRRRQSQGSLSAAGGKVCSPMPGKVVSIKVKVGQPVQRGDGVVIVEAMKMQNEFKSEIDGVVQEIKVSEGDAVESGMVMVLIA